MRRRTPTATLARARCRCQPSTYSCRHSSSSPDASGSSSSGKTDRSRYIIWNGSVAILALILYYSLRSGLPHPLDHGRSGLPEVTLPVFPRRQLPQDRDQRVRGPYQRARARIERSVSKTPVLQVPHRELGNPLLRDAPTQGRAAVLHHRAHRVRGRFLDYLAAKSSHESRKIACSLAKLLTRGKSCTY